MQTAPGQAGLQHSMLVLLLSSSHQLTQGLGKMLTGIKNLHRLAGGRFCAADAGTTAAKSLQMPL